MRIELQKAGANQACKDQQTEVRKSLYSIKGATTAWKLLSSFDGGTPRI
jgi:hypothetical protein